MVSTDNGLNFSVPTTGLNEVFSSITDVKFILEDHTDPLNPIVEAELVESISSIYGNISGKYVTILILI